MSDPIITFNNRTLRVEGEDWNLEVRVLASGRQLAIRCNGTVDGGSEIVIRPDHANQVFISSRASEKETAMPEQEQRCGDCMQIIDPTKPHTCREQVSRNKRGNKP